MLTPPLAKALQFMIAAHGPQIRKYTKEPYAVHPIEVAEMVASRGYPEGVVIAALLHDVLEDTQRTAEDIKREFGELVLALVLQVTDVSRPSDGNRHVRKALDRDHLAKSTPYGATIKLADLISNTRSVVAHDPGFAKVYLAEKIELLKVLGHGDAALHREATVLVQTSNLGVNL